VLATTLVTAMGAPSAAAATPRYNHDRHQQVTLSVLPQVRQAGATPAPLRAAHTVVTATFEPAGSGRTVQLQRWRDGAWRNVAKAVSTSGGPVELFMRYRADARYRVVAAPWRGLPELTSDPVVNHWGAPDFADEFEGDQLSSAWQHRIQFYNPWGGRSCSKGSPDAVTVGGGVVQLSSMPDPEGNGLCPAKNSAGQPIGHFPYRLNGHISTQHSADFLYGVAAARMRFPESLGQHASFWLQPRGLLTTGTTPWGAEIDVVEWYGATAQREVMASAIHVPQPDGSKMQIGGRIRNPDRFLATRSDTWWTRYHVFSIEWTPTEYVFHIDGHEVWRTDQGISDVPEFLILSMLSSDFELPHVGTDPTPRTADVDWVAFWRAS
jgi:beta-glucanase (GH16 family)